MKWAALAIVAACGTPPPGLAPDSGACEPYVVPTSLDLSMPARSFATDVMPVMTMHCASCHGSSVRSGGLFLGDTANDAAAVYKNLVGVPSAENASMDFVTASDPARSFLMHKLDGDQCQYDAMCSGGTCQHAMPMLGGQLTETERDAIRSWIYQGAMND